VLAFFCLRHGRLLIALNVDDEVRSVLNGLFQSGDPCLHVGVRQQAICFQTHRDQSLRTCRQLGRSCSQHTILGRKAHERFALAATQRHRIEDLFKQLYGRSKDAAMLYRADICARYATALRQFGLCEPVPFPCPPQKGGESNVRI